MLWLCNWAVSLESVFFVLANLIFPTFPSAYLCHNLDCVLLHLTTWHNTQHHTAFLTEHTHKTPALPPSSHCRTLLASSQLLSYHSTGCHFVASRRGHCHRKEVNLLSYCPKTVPEQCSNADMPKNILDFQHYFTPNTIPRHLRS
jgi:hypothetical protein